VLHHGRLFVQGAKEGMPQDMSKLPMLYGLNMGIARRDATLHHGQDERAETLRAICLFIIVKTLKTEGMREYHHHE